MINDNKEKDEIASGEATDWKERETLETLFILWVNFNDSWEWDEVT